MTRVCMGLGCLVWVVAASPAGAQWSGDVLPVSMLAPQTLGFETAAPTFPEVVNTAGALVTAVSSGAYEFRCPDAWAGAALDRVAAIPDGGDVFVVTDGSLWRSTDVGCTFEAVALPLDGLQVVDAVALFGQVYVLANGFVSGVVFSVGGDGVITEVHRWGQGRRFLADTGFQPTGMVAWRGSGMVGGVVLVGHEPTPQVWAALAGGDGSSLVGWRELGPLLSLNGVVSMAARGVSPSGGVWVLVRHATGDRLVYGMPEQPGGFATGSPFVWTADAAFHGSVHGPVWVGDGWVAVKDGRRYESGPLDSTSDVGAWEPGVSVDWTGLSMVDDRAFASDAHMLWEVSIAADGGLTLDPMFRHAQVGPPASNCGVSDGAGCVEAWSTFQQVADIVDQVQPATSPVAPAVEGCALSQAATGASLWWLVAGWLMVRRRVGLYRV